MLGIKNLKLTLRIEKEVAFTGLVIDIEEKMLRRKKTNKELSNLSEEILEFLQDIHSMLFYKYAFCEHEGEIIYSPKDFYKLDDDIYSIAVIPLENEFRIRRGSWSIDGYACETDDYQKSTKA
jgi:hypothetical protein